jgi:2-methylfumaryl-CoA isomerase
LPAWDLITGQMVAVGLLAAERHRVRTREGQHVKLPLQDVGLAVMAHLGFIAEAQQGRPRERHGNELFGAFGRDFVCRDGARVMVVGLTGKQWQSICDATDIHGQLPPIEQRLGVDLRLEGDRFRARADIAAVVAAWVSERTLEEVAGQFDRHGVCWSRYQSIAQLALEDPECSPANPMFTWVEQQGVGPVLSPSIPLNFQGTGRLTAKSAPRLGEHTEEVLHEVLGMDAHQFGRLHDQGIVGGP